MRCNVSLMDQNEEIADFSGTEIYTHHMLVVVGLFCH